MLNHQIKTTNILRKIAENTLWITLCITLLKTTKKLFISVYPQGYVFELLKKIDASSEGLLAKSKGIPKVERR
ncbi:hypothetical protein QI17_11530 [Enterococcus faecalis]|nr:hypothetical protein QI17_11530 [Enterococcus faecalis]